MGFVEMTIADADAHLPSYDLFLSYFHHAPLRKFLMYWSNRLEEFSYFIHCVLLVGLNNVKKLSCLTESLAMI